MSHRLPGFYVRVFWAQVRWLRERRWVSASDPHLCARVTVLFRAREVVRPDALPSRWRVFRALVRLGVVPIVAAAVVRCAGFPGRPLSERESLAWRAFGWRITPPAYFRRSEMPEFAPELAGSVLTPSVAVLPALARAFAPVSLRAAFAI